jgi:hypothetical protein
MFQHLAIKIGVLVAAALITVQWLAVATFVSGAYVWWAKANDPFVTAGVKTTTIWSVASLVAIGYSLWAYDRLCRAAALFRFVPLLVATAGLAGFLVFVGLFGFGILSFVDR